MDGEDRTLRLRARRPRRAGERGVIRLPDGSEPSGAAAEHRREVEEYARQAMVSSARAHDRAAALLEGMATAHPEEAELHLQSAARHRRWADNDRSLAQQYGPRRTEPDRT
ncbi:hypothetical protein [Actinomadura sp. WMMA1423]|uniref:hypothetical protein n=1 Tax=Actinomadura sp. WMMA1423 TaxID=2591108 RepID=UPI00143DB9B8|nr:hypothetical protein [Actinomadura sp. WMMA1423]